MMKTFIIGKDRSLKLGKNNDGLSNREEGSKKTAVFTPARALGICPTMSGRNRPTFMFVIALFNFILCMYVVHIAFLCNFHELYFYLCYFLAYLLTYNQLYRLSQGEDVAYCNHYSGGWHVSVTK